MMKAKICMLVGALLMIVALFLPFASASEEYRERLDMFPDGMFEELAGISNAEAADMSLVTFGRISVSQMDGGSNAVSVIILVLIVLIGLFALLCALFALLKKPIASIVFNALSFGSFLLLKWDFEDRGAIPNSNYDWGFAQYVLYIGAAAVLVGGAIMLIAKRKEKQKGETAVAADASDAE